MPVGIKNETKFELRINTIFSVINANEIDQLINYSIVNNKPSDN